MAHDAADAARRSADQAGKDAEEASKIASAAWGDVEEMRRKEVAEAKRRAEEARKEAEKAKEKEGTPCVAPAAGYGKGGMMGCLLTQDDAYVDTDAIEDLGKKHLEALKELSSLTDLEECIKDPTVTRCAAFAMALTPTGKVAGLAGKAGNLAGKGLKGAKELAEASRLGKISKARNAVLKDGKPLGKPDKPGKPDHMVTPEERSEVADNIRKELGAPDKVIQTKKGTIEVWELEGGNINYRNFSTSGGKMDPTIDFSEDLQKEFGLKRYHIKH
ncbi:hypothetical protein [Streptomyces chrestomyceticus]|uniref:hypothetical protein n=1 Tax=Streptomyces chrestomyceticus TaxID=68185 RepID=UPI0019D27EC9|nr:hypothetical protein [Streptomyces chrestomyceticus]